MRQPKTINRRASLQVANENTDRHGSAQHKGTFPNVRCGPPKHAREKASLAKRPILANAPELRSDEVQRTPPVKTHLRHQYGGDRIRKDVGSKLPVAAHILVRFVGKLELDTKCHRGRIHQLEKSKVDENEASLGIDDRRCAPLIKRFPPIISLLWAFCLASVVYAQPDGQFKNMREALQALKSAKSPSEAEQIRATLPKVPVESHDDLMALYDEAKSAEENVPTFAEPKTLSKYGRESGAVAARLRGCTDPRLQSDIAALLGKEYQTLKPESGGHPLAVTPSAVMKSELRKERIKALMDAAGEGKNSQARHNLWKIIELEHDANYGQLAAIALGKIGDSGDLDQLLGMIKSNPKLRLSLSGFGAMVAPRVVREITVQGIAPDIKARLSMELRESSTHENLDSYLPLLKQKDQTVAKAASEAIDKSIQSSDQDVIEAKFKSTSAYDRMGVIIAVGNHAWSEKYIPLLINVLQHDPDDDNRKIAAQYLGLRKVQGALPALRDASAHDKAYSVRLAASVAVERISKAK